MHVKVFEFLLPNALDLAEKVLPGRGLDLLSAFDDIFMNGFCLGLLVMLTIVICFCLFLPVTFSNTKTK